MKSLKFVSACLAMGLLAGCSSNSGNRVSKTYDITDFTAIEVSNAFEVEMMPSDLESVELVVSSKVEKDLLVEKKGSTLYIGLKKNHSGWSTCLKAYVSFKALQSITASGASDVEIKSAYDALGQNLDIDLSGASSIEGQVLNVNRLTADVSGASDLELDGNGNDMDMEVSGASKVDMDDFPVKHFSGEVSGASKVELYVTETFEGSASGASKIKVKGRPNVIKAEESGASSIQFE